MSESSGAVGSAGSNGTARTSEIVGSAAAGESPALSLNGTLDAEETAALTAVLQAVVVQAEQDRIHSPGRHDDDRTLDRRRRLGLWARPGSDSWRHAAGQH